VDTFRTLTTGLFLGALIISCISVVVLFLISKKYIRFIKYYEDPQRRRYLLSSMLSVIVIATMGIKINHDYVDPDQLVECDGWILKQKDLKPDACRPNSI
jgi:hypothetical protein